MERIQKAFATRTPTTVNSVVVTPSSGTLVEKAADIAGATAGKYVLVDLNALEALNWLNSTSNGKVHDTDVPYTNSEYIYASGGIANMVDITAFKASCVTAYGTGDPAGLAALLALIGY